MRALHSGGGVQQCTTTHVSVSMTLHNIYESNILYYTRRVLTHLHDTTSSSRERGFVLEKDLKAFTLNGLTSDRVCESSRKICT